VADPKFILSASQVGKPRPTPSGTDTQTIAPPRSRSTLPIVAALLLLLCAAGAAVYAFRGKIFKSASPQAEAKTNQPAKSHPVVPMTVYPVPTNVSWTLDLSSATFPDGPAAGSIHQHGFQIEKATLQGGSLTLRQGRSGPPDLGLTIVFFAQQGEELSGKSIEVTSNRPPPLPRVTLRWKDDQDKPVNRQIPSGYALKVVFGEAANARISGKIFICLPDEAKSFVAGTFQADIKKPPPPKAKKPQVPKAPKPTG
jgi:hypothetical protein